MSLKEVSTNGAPTAIGPYSQGIDAGNLVFVAGQVGRDPATGELPEGIEAQSARAMDNITAILDAAGLTWANVAKTTCLLADINDFEVFNGVYTKYVSDPKPARATYAVKALPRGALVEIEAFAVRD
ncbi:MAG: Rid family detoxifying hydrolase [Chloroflexota bacterium]